MCESARKTDDVSDWCVTENAAHCSCVAIRVAMFLYFQSGFKDSEERESMVNMNNSAGTMTTEMTQFISASS